LPLAVHMEVAIAPSHRSGKVAREEHAERQEIAQRHEPKRAGLEAEGAIEEAGRFKTFGALPDGWRADVLFVRFYFSGRRP